MLKGHVFKEQIFGNQIFALFINTFLNGQNGVSNNYKNGMQVTRSGNTLTVQSGAVCIQGRFLEEDTSTDISAGTDSSYCKLVIEIDLDKQNTESQLSQASYKVVKSTSGYPNLTQNDIVKNNAGIYQYELARFRTGSSGITDFQDMRTFLDFDSIYEQIQSNYQSVLDELEQELANVKDGSDYLLKSTGGIVEGPITANGGITGDLTGDVTGNSATATKLQTSRNISLSGDVTGSASFDGSKNVSISAKLTNVAVLTGSITTPAANSGDLTVQKDINYPTGYNANNCIPISYLAKKNDTFGWATYTPKDAMGYTIGSSGLRVLLKSSTITIAKDKSDDLEPASTVNYKIVLMKIS